MDFLPTETISEILGYCSITDILSFEKVYPKKVQESGIYQDKFKEFKMMKSKLDGIIENLKMEVEIMREHRYQSKRDLWKIILHGADFKNELPPNFLSPYFAVVLLNAKSHQLLFEKSASYMIKLFEKYYQIFEEFQKMKDWISSKYPNYELPDFNDRLVQIIMEDPLLIEQTPWINYVLKHNFGCDSI